MSAPAVVASSKPPSATFEGTMSAPTLKPRWRRPGASAYARVFRWAGRDVIPHVDDVDQSVSLLDVATGDAVWRHGDIPGVSLSLVPFRDLLLVSGSRTQGLDLKSGRTVWSSRQTYEWEAGENGLGIGLFRRRECDSTFFDERTGQGLTPRFPGATKYFRHGPDGSEGCSPRASLLGRFGETVVVVARNDFPELPLRIRAFNTSRREAWSAEVASLPGVVRIEGTVVVLEIPSDPLEVVALDMRTGKRVWSRAYPRPSKSSGSPCDDDHRVDVRAEGDAILVQVCSRVELLAARDGAVRWSRDVGHALAALEGERDEHESSHEQRSTVPLEVQWLSAAGDLKERLLLSPDVTRVTLTANGVLAQAREMLSFVTKDGRTRWQGEGGGDPFQLGRWIIVHVRPQRVMVLDGETGKPLGVVPNTSWIVRRIPAERPSRGGTNEAFTGEPILIVATEQQKETLAIPLPL